MWISSQTVAYVCVILICCDVYNDNIRAIGCSRVAPPKRSMYCSMYVCEYYLIV